MYGALSAINMTFTSQNTEYNREKIQALSLAKECYSVKFDLLYIKHSPLFWVYRMDPLNDTQHDSQG